MNAVSAPMTNNEPTGMAVSGAYATIKWPTSQNTLHIPLYDFMKLPCETPEALITTLKMQMRLHGVDLEHHDGLRIDIDFSGNVVRVKPEWDLPF